MNIEDEADFIGKAIAETAEKSAERTRVEETERKIRKAAYQVALATDKASEAAHGPRFMFEEYIAEIEGILRKEFIG